MDNNERVARHWGRRGGRWYLPGAALAVLATGMLGCSSEPAKTAEVKTETPKKAEGPPEPVTAKTAFYAMYTPARSWASDLMALSLESGEINGVKNADGKAGLWTAVFASPSLHQIRTYTWAAADELPNFSKGVRSQGTDPWPGPTAKAMPFQNSDFTVDSDAAYKTALEKGSSWVEKNPDKPLKMSLGAASRFPAPVWYFLWGTTTNGYAALINATTGNPISGK